MRSAVFAFVLLGACFSTTGPCEDYCSYICDCHAGEEGFDCEQCRTEYSGADPALEDECETELVDLQAADADAGTGCAAGDDTAG